MTVYVAKENESGGQQQVCAPTCPVAYSQEPSCAVSYMSLKQRVHQGSKRCVKMENSSAYRMEFAVCNHMGRVGEHYAE